MGFAIGYESTKPVPPDVARRIIVRASHLSEGRTWLSCEPVILDQDATGRVSGVSKPNFTPVPDDVASAQAEGLPDGTVNDLLEILSALSAQFAIDWEISYDYGPIGSIRRGICDPEVKSQCSALNDLAGDLLDEGFDFPDP